VTIKYPLTLTLPIDTMACTQKWRYVVENGEKRIETTYNEPYTLACALFIAGVMTAREIARLYNWRPSKIRGGY